MTYTFAMEISDKKPHAACKLRYCVMYFCVIVWLRKMCGLGMKISRKMCYPKSAPSFKKYVADHKPEHAFRFSKRGYRKDGDFTNLPLYLARKTKNLL